MQDIIVCVWERGVSKMLAWLIPERGSPWQMQCGMPDRVCFDMWRGLCIDPSVAADFR